MNNKLEVELIDIIDNLYNLSAILVGYCEYHATKNIEVSHIRKLAQTMNSISEKMFSLL